MEEKTVWREMADANYATERQRVDWTGIPQVHDYMSVLMTGRTQAQRGGWVLHTLDRYLTPLVESGHSQHQDGLSFVTFGCGPAVIEKTLIENGWPIKKIVCREYDAVLGHAAEANLLHIPIEKSFEFFDFNHPNAQSDEKFDVVFFCHSLHHCQNLEEFFPYLNSLLDFYLEINFLK